MSVPTNSTSPTPISVSDPTVVAGETSVVRLGKRLRDWIVGLSPAGATVYDTGWVACTLAEGFTGSLSVRRVGRSVYLRGTISGTWAANTTTVIGTVTDGYRPAYTVATPAIFTSGEIGWGWLAVTGLISSRKPTAGTGAQYVTAEWVM